VTVPAPSVGATLRVTLGFVCKVPPEPLVVLMMELTVIVLPATMVTLPPSSGLPVLIPTVPLTVPTVMSSTSRHKSDPPSRFAATVLTSLDCELSIARPVPVTNRPSPTIPPLD
jgi:hypothetical protein